MARYRLLAPHFIDGMLLSKGEVVEFSDDPTPDMEPLDGEAIGRLASMPWAPQGWRLAITSESLPGGRHSDGSPVLLNRPENFGRPLTYNPPQPPRGEIPHGTASEPIAPREPPLHYWAKHKGSFGPSDPLRPY